MSIIVQVKSHADIKIKQKKVLHQGFVSVARYELEQRYFNGDWSSPYTRELALKQKAIGALPYDPRIDQVVLIEQFRAGALAQTVTPWMVEIVAGVLEQPEQESPIDLVKREMLEETNLEVEELIPIYDYFTSPGYSTERVKLFCVKVDATKAPLFCGLREEQEDIKIHRLSTKAAFAAVAAGEINNGLTIIALQWLELNLDQINKQWKR